MVSHLSATWNSPKMLPMCFFMPPGLASCLPKFRACYNGFLEGPLGISVTKQTFNLESVSHVGLLIMCAHEC